MNKNQAIFMKNMQVRCEKRAFSLDPILVILDFSGPLLLATGIPGFQPRGFSIECELLVTVGTRIIKFERKHY